MTLFRASVLLGIALLAGCTANEPIRTAAGTCAVASDAIGTRGSTASPCRAAALEEVTVKLDQPTTTGATTAKYLLGYVEFDDEGKSWQFGQQDQIFDRMKQESDKGDISIVIFVHGWKHNAGEDDGNVRAFVDLLDALTRAEQQPSVGRPRRVFGLYAGWRGESGPPGLLDNLSFWTRKAAAERVAEGSIRGLLGRARAFRDTLNATSRPDRKGTRLLTIGHSFGALVVYSALEQYFVDRAAESFMQARYFPDARPTDHSRERETQAFGAPDRREVAGYGDLVVLINPAFEAIRYEPIRELVTAFPRGVRTALPFPARQSPILVEITSIGDGTWDGDWATGITFPIGRAVSTGLERTRIDTASGEDEKTEILTAIGHYEPFWTHELTGPATAPPKGTPPIVLDAKQECAELARFERDNLQDGRLRAKWTRTFANGAVLTQGGKGGDDPSNPFWIVHAHPTVLKDHDDISNPVLESFLTKLYQDIELRKDPACGAGR